MKFYYHPFDADKYAEANSYGDEERKVILREEAKKHFKLGRPHHDNLTTIDGKVMLRKPPMFWNVQDVARPNPQTQQVEFVKVPTRESMYAEWVPGSITLSLPETGMPRGGDRFWVIPPGGCVDVPSEIPVQTVKDASPHLITEDEARALGLLDQTSPSKSKLK